MAAPVLVLLTACAAGPRTEVRSSAVHGSAGPWADQFAESAEDASAFELAVLQDGVITPAELEEAQGRKRACLRDAGIDWSINEDGTSQAGATAGGELGSTDEVHAILQECAHRFDRSITYLFTEVRRNPERRDEARITVACLRESGVVRPDYDERRWRADDEDGTYPFDVFEPRVEQCRLDPLGLWRTP